MIAEPPHAEPPHAGPPHAEPPHAAPLILRAVAALALLVAALWCLARALPGSDTLLALGRQWLPPGHLSSLALFVAAGSLLSAVGLPRQSVALVGGYAFGPALGTAATLVGVTLGAGLACQVARTLGRPRLARHFPALVATLESLGRERVFVRTLALRLFPVGSNLLLNVAAGVARVERRAFLAASLLGFLPQTLVFGIAGDGVGASSPASIALAVALLVLSIVLGLAFGRAARR